MNPPEGLPPLCDADPLGRGIFNSREVHKAARGHEVGKKTVPVSVFRESLDADSLSVDRLDHATDAEMAQIGDEIAAARGSNRSFYGWAVVTVEEAAKNGRWVEPTPLLSNLYHADIYMNLPDSVERADKALEHAHELALKAEFRPRPQ